MYLYFRKLHLFLLFFLLFSAANAQPPAKNAKYQGLLWEISGNGLKKPSYLFGTMHVSNKKVFHLSDSFFIAIRNADVVALELNPDTWQEAMVRMDREKQEYLRFYTARNLGYGYINENSFRPESDFERAIQKALQESPMVINSLLYRTREYQQDYEEDTFLDMYIYQTGKKLGKRATGVENYAEMERLTTEAVIDRSKEKNKKKKRPSFDFEEGAGNRSDEAYRKGDLDLLDSLQKAEETSEAFMEKFLYRRNEIQAHSIDTIIRKGQSLFVGVGAAHLPGVRGVIEELRRKGYRLRPIRMADRDAQQRDKIDKLRVPVTFRNYTSPDGMIRLQAPGELYGRDDIANGNGWQYADMSNGAYYMITRVPMLNVATGIAPAKLLRKTDSMLYENIPGKLLQKKFIDRNGYRGLDVKTKTRRGDIQRYQLFFTPFELIMIKMSGNGNYAEGAEAETFFGSVTLKNESNPAQWVNVQPPAGGFSLSLPHTPYMHDDNGGDWTWSAVDKEAQYLLLKRTLFNYSTLPHDTLKLALMEESYIGAEKNRKTLQRIFDTASNRQTVLQATYLLNDTVYSAVKYLVSGPFHFLLAARAKTRRAAEVNNAMSSFRLAPFRYNNATPFTDSLVHFTVQTPIVPHLRDELKRLLHQLTGLKQFNAEEDPEYSNSGDSRALTFTNDTTGEMLTVQYNELGKYFSVADSFRLKKDSLIYAVADRLPLLFDNMEPEKEYHVIKQEFSRQNDQYTLETRYSDTGSTTQVNRKIILKDNHIFQLYNISPTGGFPGSMVETFFSSFTPEITGGKPVYISKVDSFFADYYSEDTLTQQLARSAIARIYFTVKDIPRMQEALNRLKLTDKKYFDLKTEWIDAIGDIPADTIEVQKIVNALQTIYEKTADTALFQNKVLRQLVNQKTRQSYALFKNYLLQDPPVSGDEYSYDYSNDFFRYEDSLELLQTLFPEILQLVTLDDYKSNIQELLVKLVDSGRLKPAVYEPYVSRFLFDARIALKKQQNQDEKKVQAELEKAADGDDEAPAAYNNHYRSNSNIGSIMEYVTLLLPYADKNAGIQRLLSKLWQTRDDDLKFVLMMKMIALNKPYPDTLPAYFAAKEQSRGQLYYQLALNKKENLFPAVYRNQADMARAFLYANVDDPDEAYDGEDYDSDRYSSRISGVKLAETQKMDSIQFIKKAPLTWKGVRGYIYVYQYRSTKEDKWKIALSGLQPEDGTISWKNSFTELTATKIKEDEPLEPQLDLQLKKAIFAKNIFTSRFFVSRNAYNYFDSDYR